MKLNKFYVTFSLSMAALIVYLFVTAPPPLPNDESTGLRLPTRVVLQLANNENKIARSLYTKEIVQAGKKRGIKFNEHWQQADIIAGPLPAQFLRQTALYLEKTPVRLGLYLGSDYPIRKANQLSGVQLEIFNKMKRQQQDHYFHLPSDQTYVYMSPDVAIAKACVDCHNKHKSSPKTNWQLDDVMGATTWLYPTDSITLSAALELLSELRQGFRHAYDDFLSEIQQLNTPPAIGRKWPRQGYFVPSADAFMQQLSLQASGHSLDGLMKKINRPE